jgi:hypothetical protein
MTKKNSVIEFFTDLKVFVPFIALFITIISSWFATQTTLALINQKLEQLPELARTVNKHETRLTRVETLMNIKTNEDKNE